MRRWLVLGTAAVMLAACADTSTSASKRPPSPLPEPAATAPSTPATTSTTVVPRVAAMAATPTCPAVPARRPPDPHRPRYTLEVDVRPAENVVRGALTLTFTPDVYAHELVFRLWPNGPRLRQAGARLDAGPVTVDGGVPQPGQRPDPTTLVVPLRRPLRGGDTATISMPWTLTLPGPNSDRIARIGDTVRLGSFFPILAWEPGTGWGRQPATTNFAEAGVSPTADFDLRVTAPPGLQVIASGVPDGAGRWTANAVRDVALSVGRFRVVEGTAGPVRVVVGVEGGVREDPNAYLSTVVRSLDDFARRFGPYPWPVYTLAVTPGLSGGIEYPVHVLQGPGSGGRTTQHEVAHQWFYGLVGNDQGRDPWLDEGLATWAEARHLGNLGEIRARSIPRDARGRAGAPMRYWNGRSSYYRGVYVQGAQALAALGDPGLVDCALRLFVAQNAFRVAQVEDLVAALRVVFPNAPTVLVRYGVR